MLSIRVLRLSKINKAVRDNHDLSKFANNCEAGIRTNTRSKGF